MVRATAAGPTPVVRLNLAQTLSNVNVYGLTLLMAASGIVGLGTCRPAKRRILSVPLEILSPGSIRVVSVIFCASR